MTTGFAPAPAKESGIGLSSLIVSIATFLLGWLPLLGLVVWGVVSEINQTPLADDDPLLILGGCSVLLGLILALVGTGLGIAGCCLRGTRKRFSIIGLCLNALFLVVAAFLLVVGLATGA